MARDIIAMMLPGRARAAAKIDGRHMWLAKRVSDAFSTLSPEQVEKSITTLASLARVDAFLEPNGPSTMSAHPPGAAAQRAKMHSALCQSGLRFEETASSRLPIQHTCRQLRSWPQRAQR